MKKIDDLLKDPRVIEGKKLLLEALHEATQSITGPQESSNSELTDLIKAFSKMRGGDLYYPYIGSGLGHGSLVQLLDGSVKYDFITGIGVHGFGHSHPAIVESALDAALCDVIMEGNLQQNEDAVKLTQTLLHLSGLDHCFLSTSGAMANENALKLCFQKRWPATRILAFDHCFMGRTLALSQVTDKVGGRVGLPLNVQVDYIPFYDEKDPQGSLKRSLDALNKILERYPCSHACMVFELVQGEGGYNIGTTSYFKAIMEVLKTQDILILVDEVQTFGRTTRPFAFQHFALEEEVDVVSIGKLSQTCATLFRSSLKPRPGLMSQTFTTATSAVRAAQKTIDLLFDGDCFGEEGRNSEIHRLFAEEFEGIRKRTGLIEGPYGIGSMIALTPFGGDSSRVLKFTQALFEAGVMTFVCGTDPMKIRMLVPMLVIKDEEIRKVCNIIEKTLKKVGKDS